MHVTSYNNATVTFSDGRQREVSKAEVLENQTLEVTIRQEFTPSSAPGFSDVSDLKWMPGERCVVTDTVLYAPHEWRQVSQRPKRVLCAVLYDPSDGHNPTKLVVVKNELGSDVTVSELIRSWLSKYAAKWGSYQATYPGKQADKPGTVPNDEETALLATYMMVDTGGSRGPRASVRFWLAEPPQPISSFGIV